MYLDYTSLDLIVFDFDGVLTDDHVYVDGSGVESVCCHRGDGLAFDVLRKLNVNVIIISTENNSVVAARAKKIQLPVFQGVGRKESVLKQYVEENQLDISKTLYVGNDINDYRAMKNSGLSACPSDSHEEIKSIANYILSSKGGRGVAREVVEKVMGINFISVLYKE